VDEVWSAQLRQKRGDDIGEKDNSFGDIGSDEIESSGKDDDVKDVVDKTCVGDVS